MAKYGASGALKNSEDWYIDSGCSNHMTFNKSLFSSYTPGSSSEVDFGNHNSAKIAGSGDITIKVKYKGRLSQVKISNVLHVPDLGYQLLSVQTWDLAGYNILFVNKSCLIKNKAKILATGTLVKGLYRLEIEKISCSNHKALVSRSLESWHERLAHISPYTVNQMKDIGLIEAPSIMKQDLDKFLCEGCIYGKGHRNPIRKKSESRTSQLLEIIHSDVNGPIEPISYGGSRYFVTFIDDFSKWTVVYPMKRNSEAFEHFKTFHAYAQNHTGLKMKTLNIIQREKYSPEYIKTLRTDRGGEYLSNNFSSYLREHGIRHQLTIAYTPQQNGTAERMNRTLLDLVRSNLYSKTLDKKHWAEALQTVVYIRNRVPSKSLTEGKTPFEVWNGFKPDLSHTKIFGSTCWYVIPKSKVKKLDRRSRQAIFLGYLENSKGYKLWDIDLRKPVISRDVIFKQPDNHETSKTQKSFEIDITDHGGKVPALKTR